MNDGSTATDAVGTTEGINSGERKGEMRRACERNSGGRPRAAPPSPPIKYTTMYDGVAAECVGWLLAGGVCATAYGLCRIRRCPKPPGG